jgi:flagellar basal body-associated protein FliL
MTWKVLIEMSKKYVRYCQFCIIIIIIIIIIIVFVVVIVVLRLITGKEEPVHNDRHVK